MSITSPTRIVRIYHSQPSSQCQRRRHEKPGGRGATNQALNRPPALCGPHSDTVSGPGFGWIAVKPFH